MKQAIALNVTGRDEKTSPKNLRKQGVVPAVVYGNEKNTPIQCVAKELHNVYVAAGENRLVEVSMDGKKIPCLIHEVTLDPVTGNYDHVDFYAVDMTKKVTTRVPVVFTGESPAVKNLGGVLLTVHSELEVSCLPNEIPSEFTVSLGGLENLHDSITVKMLSIPSGVAVKESPETVILIVQEPRKEEVIEVATPAEGAAAEGAAPAEGAAAAAPGAAPAAGGAKPAADAKAAPAKK